MLQVNSTAGFDASDMFAIITEVNCSMASSTMTNNTITITENIILNYTLPINQFCKGMLYWMMDDVKYPLRNISIS